MLRNLSFLKKNIKGEEVEGAFLSIFSTLRKKFRERNHWNQGLTGLYWQRLALFCIGIFNPNPFG